MAKRTTITLALVTLCVLNLAAGATEVWPDSNNSLASAANCGRFTVSPCGNDHLDGTPSDNGTDYTVTLVILSITGEPVVGLPATDMYLWHGDLATCSGNYCVADGPTDASGTTTFSGPIHAGMAGDANDGIDCDIAFLYVYALGLILNGANPLCLATDSPDLNGDLLVNVADFGKYASDFNCLSLGDPCDPCHDYDESDDNNVSDFAIFGSYFNDCVCR